MAKDALLLNHSFFFLIQKLKLCHIRQLLHVAVLYITAKEKKKRGGGIKNQVEIMI